MHNAYIGGRSENNIKCVVHDDLCWKNQTTRYILPCHWLYKRFSQFHSSGTYSVLSRSHSIASVVCLHLQYTLKASPTTTVFLRDVNPTLLILTVLLLLFIPTPTGNHGNFPLPHPFKTLQ